MARKPKRMSRKELRQPDEVQVALKGMWDWIEAHWKLLVAAAAGLLVVGAVSTFLAASARSSRQETSESLAQAIAPLAVPVGADEASLPPPLEQVGVFAERTAAWKAAADKLDAFLADHGSGDVATVARFVRATLPVGEAGADAQALQAWLAEHGASALAPAARLRAAEELAAAGKRDEALAAYQALADASEGKLKALALMGAGDLSHPLLGGGDAAAARQAYEAAGQIVGPRPKPAPGDILAASFAPSWVHAELERKLALLP